MGFLNKKKNTEDSGDLDMPPPPPPLDSGDQGPPAGQDMPPPPIDRGSMPPLPSAGTDDGMPPPPMDQGNMPLPPVGSGDSVPPPAEGANMNMPPLGLEAGSEEHVLPPEQDTDVTASTSDVGAPEEEQEDDGPKRSFEDLFHNQDTASEEHSEEPAAPILSSGSANQIFIEVGRYKKFLSDINKVKKALKQSDDEVSELITDINEEEKIFSDLHNGLVDIEHKLSELEGSIFEK